MKKTVGSRLYLALGTGILALDAVWALFLMQGETVKLSAVLVSLVVAAFGGLYLRQAFVALKKEQQAAAEQEAGEHPDLAEKEIRAAYPAETEGMKLSRAFYLRERPQEKVDIWYSTGERRTQKHFFRVQGSAWIMTDYDELNAALLMLRNGVFDPMLYSAVQPSDSLTERLKQYCEAHPERKEAIARLKEKAFAELEEARVVQNFAALEELQKLRLVSLVSAQSRDLRKRFVREAKKGVNFGELAYVSSLRFLYCIMLADVGKKRVKGERGYILLEPLQALGVDFSPYRELAEEIGTGFRVFVDLHSKEDEGRVRDALSGRTYVFSTFPVAEEQKDPAKPPVQVYGWQLTELQ